MINEEEKNSASWRWEQKAIINSRIIYDCDIDRKAIFNGNGEIQYSQEFVKKDWGTTSLMLEASTDIQDVRPRPSCSFSVAFDHENWSPFNRLSVWVYPKAQGFVNFYFHVSITNQANQSVVHAPSLIPNEWNHVFFEFTDFSREDVVKISMGPLLMGCPPEAEPIASFFFSNIVLEEVKPDYDFGWNLEDRIAYCHSGYFLTAEKKAIVEMKNPILFEIINESKEVVLTKLSTTIENEYGLFQELDFTNITSSGYYQIKMANQTTPFFEISSFPYRNAVLKSVEFLKSLRCGCEVQGVHGPCHITHHTIHPLDQRLVSDNGGWHDAGDVSQFEICTAEIVHSLIDCYEKIKSIDEDLAIKLLDEAKWGAHWLLKTHFGDGY